MSDSQRDSNAPLLAGFGEELRAAARERDAARRQAPPLRVVVLVVVFLLALFVTLTPAGRALAERVGELIGIGEPSSVQESDLRDPRLAQTQELAGPVLVANSGTLLSGDYFEIVAWGAYEHHSPAVSSCLGVVYPDVAKQETGKWCIGNGSDELDSEIHVFGMGQDRNLPGYGTTAPYTVIGVTEADVESVSVTYEDDSGTRVEAPTVFGRFTDELIEKTGATRPFGFFVASIPYDGAKEPAGEAVLLDSPALKSVLATANGASGESLGKEDAGAQYRRSVEQSIEAQALRDSLEHCQDLLQSNASHSEIRDACSPP